MTFVAGTMSVPLGDLNQISGLQLLICMRNALTNIQQQLFFGCNGWFDDDLDLVDILATEMPKGAYIPIIIAIFYYFR